MKNIDYNNIGIVKARDYRMGAYYNYDASGERRKGNNKVDNIYKEFRWYVSFLLNCGKGLD